MALTNPQNPNCPNCNKSGLAILPVRYAVVPLDISATLPESLGDKITCTKLSHNKYALRTLRQGFLYLLHEKHPRSGHKKWEIYAASAAGTLWRRIAPTALEPVSEEPVCSRNGHNIPASIITIENPEKCAQVWMAFSEHPWSQATLDMYERDAAQRDRRMQTFLPAEWIRTSSYRHGLAGTEVSLRSVVEYSEGSGGSRLAGGKIGDISKTDGTYDHASLAKQSTSHPCYLRKMQAKALVEAMTAVGLQAHGKPHAPVVVALWDSVGITQELNGYRNDAAGWISKYGTERELEITAINAIEGVKKALETREAQKARAAADGNFIHWTPESSATRLENYSRQKPNDQAGRARQEALCLRWEQDSTNRAPGMIAKRRESGVELSDSDWRKHMSQVDYEIEQWRERRNSAGHTVSEIQRDRSKRWEESAIAETWPKYRKKIDQVALASFRANHEAFLTDAAALVDGRTDDLLKWLDSSQLVNELTEYHPQDLSDGVAFEEAVGAMIFGMSSSEKGALKISSWVSEAKATEQNLLWRAIAANQSEGIEAINAALAAAMSYTGTPFTESALNAARDSIKHLAKIADLAKKSLSLHNSLRKDGIRRVATGGIERILMTVGDRFFQPFIKRGADLLSEKFIQSLLLARAGANYAKIMDLMLAEAKFGAIGRTETLVALSMGHVIAGKNTSESQKALRTAWKALASDADVPKQGVQPQRAGAFNEAKELRFAMAATLLQGLFVFKLAQDAEKDPKNRKLKNELLAAELSLGAGLIDLGATAIKGLSIAKDTAISFQILKLSGGILSGGAACIATASDLTSSYKEFKANRYAIGFLYGCKAISNFCVGGCSTLAAVSYAKPIFERFASTLPSTTIGRIGAIAPRLTSPAIARLFAGRAMLMLGGLWLSVGVIAIQLLIWKLSDNELQVCGTSARLDSIRRDANQARAIR